MKPWEIGATLAGFAALAALLVVVIVKAPASGERCISSHVEVVVIPYVDGNGGTLLMPMAMDVCDAYELADAGPR